MKLSGYVFKLIIFIAMIMPSLAICQENSNWLYNLSEGLGEPVTAYEDFVPEIAASGNIVHTFWMTWVESAMRRLNYRRSADNGLNWEEIVILAEGDYDWSKLHKRMTVTGNYVHIVTSRNNGGNRDLVYFRSIDGGATFEDPQVLLNTSFEMQDVNITSEGSQVMVMAIEYCHYCGVTKSLHILQSDDDGANFQDGVILSASNIDQFTSLTIEGQHVYFLYRVQIGYWANYDYEVHLMSSNDGGVTFNDHVISEPAMSGVHHAFVLLDGNNSYMPKLSAVGDKVTAVWSGWDENNTASVFVRHSPDGGETLTPLQKVSGSLDYFHAGLETIAAAGDNAYVIFQRGNDKELYYAASTNGGATFSEVQEFTSPTGNFIEGGIEPQLLIDPSDNSAFAVHTGFNLGKLMPDANHIPGNYYGLYSFSISRRPRLAISGNFLHVVMEAGGEWKQTGVFSDVNIWYRRINLNEISTAQEDLSMKMELIPNPGDGSGLNRFDNMIISPNLGDNFVNAMTVELWLKPEDAGVAKKMITQYVKGTWNLYNPESFQLWGSSVNEPVAGIVTTTGPYALPATKTLATGLWSHLAVTYQNDGSPGNFKILINGQVVNELTATGDIATKDALWILGSMRGGFGAGASDGFNGSFDELRFWNIARTPAEIRESRFTPLTGNEPGLVAYYTFDAVSPFGEITDLSGNGYTGHLMYKEESTNSTIHDLGLRFIYTQTVSSFAFQQISDGAEMFEWDFGNGESSIFVHPSISYATPGIYNVCLTGSGGEMIDTYCEEVEVKGIDRIYPVEGGNTDFFTLYIYGGGFNTNNIVKLRRNGFEDIVALQTIFDQKKTLTALFDLAQQETGEWDLVIDNGGQEMVLSEAFSIVAGETSAPFVHYNGGGRILYNRWTPQTITIGNSANVDAHGVLLWITLPEASGNDLEFLNLNILPPQIAIDQGYASELEALGTYLIVDSLFGKPNHARVYPLYFPILPAKSSFDIAVRIKLGTGSNTVPVNVWLSGPFYHSPLSQEVQACVALSITKALIKGGVSFIPGVACLTGAMAVASDYLNDTPPTPSAFEHLDTRNWGWILGSNLLECASSLYGGSILTGIITIITSGVENAQENADCYAGFRQIGWLEILYYPVGSFDPNVKSGVPGFTDFGYINRQLNMGYQIQFENKSSATAPAHEVIITDTLTFEKFDLDQFSFGPFGWGDTILFPLPYSREFSMDVDLRPGKEIVVRVTGKLDTETKVVLWQFLTLDPATMDIIFDPDLGFLPPNQTSPEGEGFVNFSSGVTDDIENNDAVLNKATIIFDSNDPIITNTHLNTFDLVAPESTLDIPTEVSSDTTFTIQLSASDDESQVRYMEIWVSENDSAFVFSHNAYGNETTYTGQYGSTYKFYSLAVDSVGNRELPPTEPDDEITVVTNSTTMDWVNELRIYPQPATDWLIVELQLKNQSVLRIDLEDMLGANHETLLEAKFSNGFNRHFIPLAVPSGPYVLRIWNGDRCISEKLLVVK